MKEITKGHWKLHFNYKYLGSHDMTELSKDGKDLIVKIVSLYSDIVEGEKGKKDECVIANLTLLDGTAIKPMIINKTNFKILAVVYKSEDVANFIGKNIAIYIKPKVWNGAEYVNALRFREFEPKIELKPIEDSELPKAAAYYKKNGNIDAFKAKRTISDEQEQQIIELSKALKVE